LIPPAKGSGNKLDFEVREVMNGMMGTSNNTRPRRFVP
jgi:hypothetical protein